MTTLQPNRQFIHMLSERLERISADSIWAHRASGVRGSLLRILDDVKEPRDSKVISDAVAMATHILSQAAKQM
jgi:hypothetical protein